MSAIFDHAVFVSYEHNDQAIADSIVRELGVAGIKCWIAHRDMPGAIPFGEGLLDAIEASRLLLMIFSPYSNKSPMVDREVAFAATQGIPIFPVKVASAEISRNLKFLIGTHNWFDASSGQLSDHFPKLISAVHRLLSHPGMDKGSQGRNAVRHLVVFSTKSQATELWLTTAGLECYLFDFAAGESLRQWTLSKNQLMAVLKTDDIIVSSKSRYEDCGVFGIGETKRWLYSKDLFPEESELRKALLSLVQAGANK